MTRLYNKEIESGWGCGGKFIFECLEDGELMGIGLGLGVGCGLGDSQGRGTGWPSLNAGATAEQTLGVEVCGQDAGHGYDAGYENGGDIHPYHESNFDARIPKPPK